MMANIAQLHAHSPENAHIKARRLMSQLSKVLDEIDGCIEYALVRPASKADKTGRGFLAFGPYNEEEGA